MGSSHKPPPPRSDWDTLCQMFFSKVTKFSQTFRSDCAVKVKRWSTNLFIFLLLSQFLVERDGEGAELRVERATLLEVVIVMLDGSLTLLLQLDQLFMLGFRSKEIVKFILMLQLLLLLLPKSFFCIVV